MFVTEQDVRNAVLPSHIQETDSWKPISHGHFLDLIDKALTDAGLQIAQNDDASYCKRFTLVDKGAKMFATMSLTSRIDDSSRLMIGLANSWNKSLAARIGFGSEVFVCSNGAFFAEKIIGRKHTKNFLSEIPAQIADALAQTKTFVEQQQKFFERLRGVTLDDKDVNDFVVRSAIDHDCITSGEISGVVEEYRKPRFAEFEPRNAWSLHNAYTEIGKRSQNQNGITHSERMVRLSGLFADTFASDLNLTATRKVILAAQEQVDANVAATN